MEIALTRVIKRHQYVVVGGVRRAGRLADDLGRLRLYGGQVLSHGARGVDDEDERAARPQQ